MFQREKESRKVGVKYNQKIVVITVNKKIGQIRKFL